MRETLCESETVMLREDHTYELAGLAKHVLDQELGRWPREEVSEHNTRYPTDTKSMRAFLEVFFTRHFFQLQNSLLDYVTSPDFTETIQSGYLRILDIGSGPAVASQAIIDMLTRMTCGETSPISPNRGPLRMTHVLNDTSSICLVTGKRMLAVYPLSREHSGSTMRHPHVFTLSTAFPRNLHQIHHLASFLGGFDLVILSYVLRPLMEDGTLQNLASGLNTLERFCTTRGRMLIIQDRFQEPLIRRLAAMIRVECREQTLTQTIYPPRGSNETGTYTYYDCLYEPRRRVHPMETRNRTLTR
jgi:hypothetical protein